MTAAWGMRMPDGVERWVRWSAWLTTALVVLALATAAGFFAGVPGTSVARPAWLGTTTVVAAVVAIRKIRLRKRLFPGRTTKRATREADAGRARLLRGEEFTAPDECERFAWWTLTSEIQTLWFGAFGVAVVSGTFSERPRGILLTVSYVVTAVILVLTVAAFAQRLRNSLRVRRAVESARRASGTLEP